jgi:predicted lipoprotein with Yx(FWY)xxD motif
MFVSYFKRARVKTAFLALLILLMGLTFTTTWAQDAPVSASATTDGIPTLVGPDGRTLYTFAPDQGGGLSTCYDECAEEWPPLTIAEGEQPAMGEGVPGLLGTTTRDDGSVQVTYNGWPLYYYHDDAAPGDANGQGIEDIWFAANPAFVMLGTNDAIGDLLIGAGGKTLYVFRQDQVTADSSVSLCFDECTIEWPPLILPPGMEPTAGNGVTGQLGTVRRADGSLQVTYNGSPLYYFHEDEDPGDANGDGVKDVWFAALPEGNGG